MLSKRYVNLSEELTLHLFDSLEAALLVLIRMLSLEYSWSQTKRLLENALKSITLVVAASSNLS